MKNRLILVMLVVVATIVVAAGGLLLAALYDRRPMTGKSDGSLALQSASLRCVLAYHEKDAIADANTEALKPNPEFRSRWSNGVESVQTYPPFAQCWSGFNVSFEGVEEYVEEPGDGDAPTILQKMCSQAKENYATSFNLTLLKHRRVTCLNKDAIEKANRAQSKLTKITS